jgi:hypothetical protein
MAPADVRRMLDAAVRGGESRSFVERMAGELVALELRVADLERAVDPRRRASIEKAHRVRNALDAGATPAQVRARFRLGRSALYRALQLSREVRDTSAIGSWQRSPLRRPVS